MSNLPSLPALDELQLPDRGDDKTPTPTTTPATMPIALDAGRARAQGTSNHHGHGHGHGHHHRRERSVSRSSSSPSPPPSPRMRGAMPLSADPGPYSHASAGGREKRRSGSSSASRSGRRPPLKNLHTNSSLHYAGSASSAAWGPSGDEDADGNRYIAMNADDTEIESARRRGGGGSGSVGDGLNSQGGALGMSGPRPRSESVPTPRSLTPSGGRAGAGAGKKLPPDAAAHPLPARITLLPHTLALGPVRLTLSRKRCEDAILLGALVFGIVKIAYTWDERALAGELTTLLILSVAYVTFRVRTVSTHPPRSPPLAGGNGRRSPVSFGLQTIREHSERRGSHPAPLPRATDDDTQRIGSRGCIWGTEEREYRECLDDGALFALLLAPMTAAAMLHGALTRLAAQPETATLPGWVIEQPLVIPSTPIRRITATIPSRVDDAIRALSALAIARRNLVQLFTLCSFVLLIQLTWSLRREIKVARAAPGSPPAGTVSIDGEAAAPRAHGTYWLKRGEWRRNRSVIALAFFVTGCCVIVKIATAYIGRGVWSDMSHSDIIIATLFYQFCLYVCVRLARRGFTLGELGIVTHAGTALFMETVNMTRTKVGLRWMLTLMQIPIIPEPYIKTYRLPTPLLIFQLALVPGSLLTGFLLSPLLYLSRHLAQRPVHRLRFPHEKPTHRRLLALGFYAGSLLVVVGIVGMWTRWCLGKRNPWLWVILFLLDGKHVWTRPALITYWGVLAMMSVAAWQRQLSRGRRHRRYVVPETRASTSSTGSGSGSGASVGVTSRGPHVSSVATQMMDRADQRMPTLSVNARRKSFHALAVAMFVPGMAIDPAFTHLSFSVAFAAFTFAEYVRYFALWPLGASVHLFLNEFIDHKDSGTAILSHFYLLAGCAVPLWLEGPSQVLAHFGVLALGIGDALASIVGRKIGYARWSPVSGKTAEGSAGFLASVVAAALAMWGVGAVDAFALTPFVVTTALVTLLEAFSAQNDNLVLPVYGWAIGTLLGV